MDTCFQFRATYLQLFVGDAMPGKPFRSSLIPYQDEIVSLRSQKPPVPYAQIAVLLHEKYGLRIRRAAIAKFVKARSGGRRVYFFRREIAANRAALAPLSAKSAEAQPDLPPNSATNVEQRRQRPKFEFTYSERYNLKRLPKEEAAAIRKKLEEEGH